MHAWNVARALLLVGILPVVVASSARAQRDDQKTQFCWSFGKFDQTVYFAESPQLDDRIESFTELLDISAIDHNLVECRYVNSEQRIAILRGWSGSRLETVDTTFLSDLDY